MLKRQNNENPSTTNNNVLNKLKDTSQSLFSAFHKNKENM